MQKLPGIDSQLSWKLTLSDGFRVRRVVRACEGLGDVVEVEERQGGTVCGVEAGVIWCD